MASPMTRQLWSAVETLADAWRRTDVARGYAEVFIDPQHELGRRLKEILSDYGGFEKQKLLLARVLQVIPEYAGFSREPGGAEFLQRGEQLGTAFLWTVEWWRSRLPAYPMMPAPQLVRDGPLSTQELTFRVPWPDELRRQGLQLTSAPPPIVADLLGTTPPSLDEAARAVGAALASCPQVRELEQAQAALTDDGRAALSNARDRARIALRPAQVDAAAGDLALDRLAYREALVADAVDSLQGDARRYSDAFDAVDRLIEQAAALFSQAVVNGPAPKIGPVFRAERLHGGHGWTEVVVPEWVGLFAQIGDVVLFDTPALTDAMYVEGTRLWWKAEQWGSATLSGPLLPDSGGLRASPWPA
jgi:hypothetical protein